MLILFILSVCSVANSQKISIITWSSHIADSLRNAGVDTMLYYNEVCGECSVAILPKDSLTKAGVGCDVKESYTQLANIFLYRQRGRYYSLEFNCQYPMIKRALGACLSIPYALTIIKILNARDAWFKKRRKLKYFFLPPIVTDVAQYAATIRAGKLRQEANISADQQGEYHYLWKRYFWIDPQIKLFRLIHQDLK